MTHYTRGRDFEYRVKRHLERHGFEVARMAGSHTAVDLMALRPGNWLFIQCKTDGRISAEQWNKLLLMAQWANATPLLASKDGQGHIVYARLTGEKRGRERPCEAWEPMEVQYDNNTC